MRVKPIAYATLVAAFALQLGGCVSTPESKEPPYMRAGYERLFDKGEGSDSFCAAGFQKDGLLYIVTDRIDYPDGRYLAVIDPRSGVFFYTMDLDLSGHKVIYEMQTRKKLLRKATCLNANFPGLYKRSWTDMPLQIISPTLRAAIASVEQDRSALANMIDAAPPHFIYRGSHVEKYQGSRIDENASLAEVAQYLKAVKPEAAQEAQRNAQLKKDAEEQARRVKADRLRAELDEKRRLWTERMRYQLKVGDPVCTHDSNLFGNVEAISGNRVKAHVIGKAEGRPGMWFNTPSKFRFSYEKIEGSRWFNREELAACSFGE